MAVTSKLTPENLLESNRNSILLFVFLQSHSNYGALSFVIHHPNVRTFCPHFSLEDHGTWQVQCTPSIDSKTAIEGLVFRSIASYMGFPFETTQDSLFSHSCSESSSSSPSSSGSTYVILRPLLRQFSGRRRCLGFGLRLCFLFGRQLGLRLALLCSLTSAVRGNWYTKPRIDFWK